MTTGASADDGTGQPKASPSTTRALSSAWEIHAMSHVDWLNAELEQAVHYRAARSATAAIASPSAKAKPPRPTKAVQQPTPMPPQVVTNAEGEIRKHLCVAADYISRRHDWRLVLAWLRGTRVEGAWTNIHDAHARLIEVASAPQLPALVDDVRYATQAYLPKSDPCHERVKNLARNSAEGLDPNERKWLANILHHAYESNAENYQRLRRYRNVLLGWSALFFGLTIVLSVIGLAKPAALPLCFPEPGVAPTASTAVAPSHICPTGKTRPTGGDVVLVGLLGVVGGALGGTNSLTRSTRATVPAYTLRVARSLLKISIGSAAAIVGLLFLRAGLAPGFSTLTSQTAILAYAVVFGVSQQLITRIADRTAERVTKSASDGRGTMTDGREDAG